jgi:DnaJ-class molecular chaperone
MPRLKSAQSRGDLFVRVKVHIPKDLTPAQTDLLRKAAGPDHKS